MSSRRCTTLGNETLNTLMHPHRPYGSSYVLLHSNSTKSPLIIFCGRILQTPLLNHAHPTLTLLARQLLAHQPLTTSPDLALHTLTHFLDRFVYKNPKKIKPKGSSAMQPAAAPEGEGVKRVRGEVQEGPVNEEGWWKRSAGSVPADQVCIHSNSWIIISS